MPSLGFPFTVSAPTTLKTSRRYVFIKQNWSDNWTFVPWLEPIQCREAAAPDISSADFLYRFGNIAREHTTTFSTYLPVTLRDWYIKIMVQQFGHPLINFWIGVVLDEEWSPKAAAAASGDQKIKAFGLESLLDRKEITGGRAEGFGNDPTQELDWSPTFNLRHRKNLSLTGNRSTSVAQDSSSQDIDNVYLFSANDNIWSNRDIAEYVLYFFGPTTPRFYLGGELTALGLIKRIHQFEGLSVRDALNRLADPKFGLGWMIRFYFGQPVVWVYSIASREFSAGGVTLPANSEPVFLAVPTTYPYAHMIDTIDIRATDLNHYDKITVQGQRVKVTASYDFETQLEKGWSDALETEYKDPISSTNPKDNDRARTDYKYEPVYQRFQIPLSWDWNVNPQGYGQHNVAITPRDDGTFSFEERYGAWNRKEFERNTVFEKGHDYTTDPPTENVATDGEPDFRPIFGVVLDFITDTNLGDDEVWDHYPDDKYHLLDKQSIGSGLRPVQMRPMDHQLGFEISVNPNHYVARNNFASAAETAYPPAIDYTEIIVTATVETDARQKVVVRNQGGTGHEVERELVITLPRAEYWYVVPDTIVGIDPNTDLPATIHPGNTVLRDDRNDLITVAVFSAAWYSVNRQAVNIPFAEIGWYVNVGTLLTEIASVWAREPIGTVITARTTNFSDKARNATTIETGYGRLDSEPPSAFFMTD